VTAIDQSPEMLALAQAAARREGLPITFHHDAVEGGLPFADASFDFVVSALMLSHVPEVDHCIAELARVLSPDGHLLITDLHPERVADGWGGICQRPGATYVLPKGHTTRDGILAAVDAAGLMLHTVVDVPIREVPPESFPDLMRRLYGDLSFCLIVLAQKVG
jgi:SAM-dependent methyltransferase